jgi:hypothetical protein
MFSETRTTRIPSPENSEYWIPQTHAGEAHELARRFIEEFIEAAQHADETYHYDAEPEEIENEQRSGFIPWTDGGWQTCLPNDVYSSVSRGGAHPAIQAIYDLNQPDCIESWWRKRFGNLPDSVASLRGMSLFNHLYGLIADEDDAREDFHEWEVEWWGDSDSIYYWKARAIYYAAGNSDNTTGEPEIYFDAYLCLDEYGRDSIPWLRAYGSPSDQTRGNWKRTIKVRDLTAELVGDLIKDATKQI